MLARVKVQPPKDVGGGVFLELDGGHHAQEVIPVFHDYCFIDRFARAYRPLYRSLRFRLERIQGLFADAFDAGGKGESQQMGQTEDSFCVGPVRTKWVKNGHIL